MVLRPVSHPLTVLDKRGERPIPAFGARERMWSSAPPRWPHLAKLILGGIVGLDDAVPLRLDADMLVELLREHALQRLPDLLVERLTQPGVGPGDPGQPRPGGSEGDQILVTT
jgi:hypothetical protein